MRLAVVLNETAGTLLGEPIAKIQADLKGWFAAAGADATVTSCSGDNLRAAIAAAASGRYDALVVGGGDGTIKTAAAALVGSDMALGILPLGTMNLLARDLQIPLGLQEAATALGSGQIQAIDVAEVNGQIFLNHSVLGLFPSMVRARERQRGVKGLARWLSLASAIYKAFHYYNLINVTVDFGDGPRPFKTPALAVANNIYHNDGQMFLGRASLDEGLLTVYLAKHRTRIGLIGLMISLVLGGWRDDADLETVTLQELTVASRRRRISVANDGEVVKLAPPLIYRIRPRALRVLVPANPAEEQSPQ